MSPETCFQGREKFVSYSDIQETITQELHLRESAMLAIYSPGIVQHVRREGQNMICTVSSISITTQLQYCPNCRRIARIFRKPENKTITEKVSHVTAKTVPPEKPALRAARILEARQYERCLFIFLLEHRCLRMTLASAKSSVVALAYDNLRASLKWQTHQFLIIFRS